MNGLRRSRKKVLDFHTILVSFSPHAKRGVQISTSIKTQAGVAGAVTVEGSFDF
jgi:hypothetical protein